MANFMIRIATPDDAEGVSALLRDSYETCFETTIQITPGCGDPFHDTGAPGTPGVGDILFVRARRRTRASWLRRLDIERSCRR